MLLKFPREVYEIHRIHDCASIELTVAIDVRSLKELFVEEDYHLLFSFANDSAAKAKWYVFTPGGVDVHYSAADLKVIDLNLVEW